MTKKRLYFLSTLKWLTALTFVIVVFLGLYVKLIIIPSLPNIDTLHDIQYQTPLRVYSQDGLLIAQFGEKKRIPIQYSDIPENQIQAFLAAEDNRFFEHGGVDYSGLARAAIQLVLTGKKKQGGSTITMQVARNFFLSKKKTYTRKIREILLSFIIEKQLTKEQILTLYLNKIYLGHRSYGISAAAQVYYGKKLADLTLAQQAMIAGLPKAPSAYNPFSNPERAKVRRNYVLNRLFKLNKIDQNQLKQALNEPISAELNSASIELEAPYVAEMVRDEAYKLYGNEIYTSGMNIFTTIDSSKQKAANNAIRHSLHQYDKRHGYRGALAHIEKAFNPLLDSDEKDLISALTPYKNVGETIPAIVISMTEKSLMVLTKEQEKVTIPWDGMEWARAYINENKRGKKPSKAADILNIGDIIRIRKASDDNSFELAQIPTASGALTAINPINGALVALVGGYDYYHSKFNRALQAKRQPGSGFKPFLYTAALSKGYTTATLINDAPVVFNDAGLEQQWRPENYSGKFFGPTRLREALVHSRNLVSIRILRDIGVNYARGFAKKFGFESTNLPKNLSLALGSGSANTYQMATAYSVFANGGFKVTPYFIERIESYAGETLYQANPSIACQHCPPKTKDPSENNAISNTFALGTKEPPPIAERVVSAPVNFLVNTLLRDVVNRGTGRRALSLGRTDLAGKTGTTNDQRDAWFNGFNPSLVAVCWVGFDNNQPLGNRETGGRAALPIWMSFMQEALKNTPNHRLPQPNGIISVRIDPETGLRSDPSNPNAIFEYFRLKNTPQATNIDFEESRHLMKEPQKNLEELF